MLMTTSVLIPAKAWKSSQALHFEATYSVNGEKVRITIKRDSYESQSYVHAHILRGKKWEFLAGLPIATVQGWFDANSPYAPESQNGDATTFKRNVQPVLDELLDQVELLLG